MVESRCILVVADEASGLKKAILQALDQAGHELMETESVEEGLRLAEASQPDLAILDADLSEGGAIEACRRLKGDKATSEICVALWSARGMDAGARAAALDAGADDVASRPLSGEELMLRVGTLLRLKRVQDELRQQWRQAEREAAERRRAQQESERRRLYLEAMLDAVPDAIVTLDTEHRITEWNLAAEQMFGYEEGEVLGQEIDPLVAGPNADALDEAQSLTKRVRSGERVPSIETVRYRRDGTPVDVRLAAAPILRNGELLGVVGAYTDISARNRAREALRRSERRFRSFVEQSRDAIVVTDEDGAIVMWNPAAERVFGLEHDDVMGRPLWDVQIELTPEGQEAAPREEMRAAVMGVIRTGTGPWTGSPHEIEIERPDGERRVVQNIVFPIDTGDGHGLGSVCRDVTELARVEEKVRFQARLLDAVGQAVIVTEPDGTIIYWNTVAESLYGWREEEVLGRDITEVTPNEASREQARQIMESLRAGERWVGQFAVQRRDGTKFPAIVSDTPVTDEDDNVVAIIGVTTDITEQKRMQEALHESEERYRSLFSSIRDAILVADTDRNIIDCNPAFSDLFGYSLDEIKGRKTRYVYESPEEFERLGAALRGHVGDPSFLFTVRYEKKSGEVFPGETNVFFLRNDQGEVTGFIGLIRDVTRRIELKETLEWQASVNKIIANLSRAILGSASMDEISELVLRGAIHLTDSAFGYVGFVDPETGHLVCPTMTREIWDVCDVEEKRIVFEQFGGLWGWVLDNHESLMTNHPRNDPRSSGTPEGHIPIQRFLSAPALVADELVGQVALANAEREYSARDLEVVERLADVYAIAVHRTRADQQLETYADRLETMVEKRTAELREAQEKLLRQQKLATLGQLAGSINHELRGPLGNIKSGAYFLDMALEDPEDDVAETVDLLAQEVDRADSIVRSLLNFVRTEEPRREDVDVNQLLEDVLESTDIPTGVDVARELDGDLPAVSGDPRQLRQVFGNLIRNGVEAMSEGGRLTVLTDRPSDDGITVSVRDTGEGISEETQKKIFEPLFSTKVDGVGLGLALTQMLVDAHGGTIEVDSSLGEGSTFKVWLPLGPGAANSG